MNTFGTSEGDLSAEVAAVPTQGRLASLVSASATYNDRFMDANGDGFSDIVNVRRASVFGKGSVTDTRGLPTLGVVRRLYAEDRSAGIKAFLQDSRALRGSDAVYGESIRARRAELLGTWKPRVARRARRVQAADNVHDQDSFYGDVAFQQTGFGQVLWEPTRGSGPHNVLAGASLRYQADDYDTGTTGDFDDDGALLANRPDRPLVPVAFVQDHWAVSPGVRLLGGLRVGVQPDYGLIPSPRLSARFQPAMNTTLRLNAGTGFRIVNLFTEDHAAYTGGRATVLPEDIRPERSASTTASLRQIIPFGVSPLTLDIDAFYTVFSNKIEPDYRPKASSATPASDGTATARGRAVTAQQSFARLPLRYTLGATLLDAFLDERRHGAGIPVRRPLGPASAPTSSASCTAPVTKLIAPPVVNGPT